MAGPTSLPQPGWVAHIRAEGCTGCGWCVPSCPDHLLALMPQPGWSKRSTLSDPAACTGCARCVVRCPFDAIHLVPGFFTQ